mmetsp:Transcript_15024/g.29527  ORF Transcript_15024/g.29527 Transcript_15024/m.29527 type:complete len:89 (-) Transcript_15024:352-618(-)
MSRKDAPSNGSTLSKEFVAIMTDTVYEELLRFRRTNPGFTAPGFSRSPQLRLSPVSSHNLSTATAGTQKPKGELKNLNQRMHGLNVRR